MGLGSPLAWFLTSLRLMFQHTEENLKRDGKLPFFYQRYVDDTLTITPNIARASNFLEMLERGNYTVHWNSRYKLNAMARSHFWVPSYSPIASNRDKGMLKQTNSGLFLHHQSHADNRYKKGLLRNMLDRAHHLFSSWSHFSDECDRLWTVFSRLNTSLTLPSKVLLTKRFVTSSSFCHLLMRQMTGTE